MTLKKMMLGVCVTVAAMSLAACEGNGDMRSSADQPRDTTYGTNEVMTIPAVDAVTGGQARVGEQAPNFTLRDLDGKKHTLSKYTDKGKIVVLEWFNPGCPFVVKHYRDSENQTMNMLAERYKGEDVVWLAVNSGAQGKQGHGIELNRNIKNEWNINHPILIDETGTVGKAYGAKRTPEMYIIDADGTLVYHGAIDNNVSPTIMGDVNYVEQALEDLMNDREVRTATSSAYGCTVKYAG